MDTRGHDGVPPTSREVPVSYAQCPICGLRFRFQSEVEAHAHDDHCTPGEVHLPPHTEREPQSAAEPQPASKLLRLP